MQNKNQFLACVVLLSMLFSCTLEDQPGVGTPADIIDSDANSLGRKILDTRLFKPESVISNALRDEIYIQSDHKITCFNYFNGSCWDLYRKSAEQENIVLLDINRNDQELYFATFNYRVGDNYDVWLYKFIMEFGSYELITFLENVEFRPTDRNFFICANNMIAYETGPPHHNIFILSNYGYPKQLPIKGVPKLLIPEENSMLVWKSEEQEMILYNCPLGKSTVINVNHLENALCNYYLTTTGIVQLTYFDHKNIELIDILNQKQLLSLYTESNFEYGEAGLSFQPDCFRFVYQISDVVETTPHKTLEHAIHFHDIQKQESIEILKSHDSIHNLYLQEDGRAILFTDNGILYRKKFE